MTLPDQYGFSTCPILPFIKCTYTPSPCVSQCKYEFPLRLDFLPVIRKCNVRSSLANKFEFLIGGPDFKLHFIRVEMFLFCTICRKLKSNLISADGKIFSLTGSKSN